MNVTKHHNVLITLENRSLRHRTQEPGGLDPDEILYQDAVDETGTVSTAGFLGNEGIDLEEGSEALQTPFLSTIMTLKEQQEVQGVSDGLLQMHGVAPGKKGEGIT